MGAIKRKDAAVREVTANKKHKSSGEKTAPASKTRQHADDMPGADVFAGLSDADADEDEDGDTHLLAKGRPATPAAAKQPDAAKPSPSTNAAATASGTFRLESSSAEAHAKQRQLAKERKAGKPNADSLQRSKQLWEQLRRKSHLPLAERKKLVADLFAIITGRVRDFVFKHDSVRIIQCALKYANLDQRRAIVHQLRGDIRTLAESRYGKFMLAKMVVEGDREVHDLVVPQFYGHVRRLINHPEASWVVDDIYRQIASAPQKAIMLREWYGAEYALENKSLSTSTTPAARKLQDGNEGGPTADLAQILAETPEKRKPMLQYLHSLINSLVQKKMTGFTMLHDAMLQYFLALTPGSDDHRAFLDEMMGDIDAESEGGGGDLFKNLAFTKSGHRLVCLALAYGTAKERKVILRVYRATVEMMAFDRYAKMVLAVALDVPDDTQMSTKSILRELVGEKLEDETQRLDKLEAILLDRHARLPLLYPMAGMARWLLSDAERELLEEVHEIREETSKKAPEVRRKGLLDYLSTPALELVVKRAASLAHSTFGCQFITETLLSCNGDRKAEAKKVVAGLAAGDLDAEGHLARNCAGGRMLKTMVLGGGFDPETQTTKLVEPRLGFADLLYPIIEENVVEWACSDSSFVVVALLESEDVDAGVKEGVLAKLKKGKKRVEVAAREGGRRQEEVVDDSEGADGKEKRKKTSKRRKVEAGNAGARILLGKIAG